MTEGTEQFLEKLIAPIVDKCNFLAKSTKAFKEIFIQKRNSFNSDFEIISFDATSFFTNINVDRVIEYILDIIFESYETTRSYFNETYFDENGFEQLVELPIRETLKRLFYQNFDRFFVSFEHLRTFWTKKRGFHENWAPISNIFCHMLEEKVIQKINIWKTG